MRRGTTPTHTFTLPIQTDIISKAYVTYAQDGIVKFEKDISDMTLEQNKISITLTQQETLKLKSNANTEIQLAVLTAGDTAMRSQVFSVPTEIILKNGEI